MNWKKALEIVINFLVLSVSITMTFLGQDPGSFMNDGTQVADLFIGEVAKVWVFQRLEGETLSCLSEGKINILVGDAAARVEREGTVRGQQVIRSSLASGLSQSLGGKIYEVAELQLAGVGEAGGEAGELPGGEGGELGQAEGEKGGQEVSRHAQITASQDCSGHSPLSAMSECQTNISFSLPACCLHIRN